MVVVFGGECFGFISWLVCLCFMDLCTCASCAALVLLFSDPMVGVLSEFGHRIHVSSLQGQGSLPSLFRPCSSMAHKGPGPLQHPVLRFLFPVLSL